MSTDLEAVATRIMRLCNESSECPFCGNDDGEHDDTQLCADLDKALNPALPSPSGEELVERVARAICEAKNGANSYGYTSDEKRDDFRRYARAAIAALPPSGALGLARELSGWLSRDTIYRDGGILTDLQRMKEAREKARELVALLGGEK